MLACLKHICLLSPICEKRAVALLFQAIKEQFLDQDLVIKVSEGEWYYDLCGLLAVSSSLEI